MKKNLTIYDLPEHMKVYQVVMNDKSSYDVSAKEKEAILKSKTQFVELRSGEVINKSYIVVFKLNKNKTQQNYVEMDFSKQKQLVERISRNSKDLFLLDINY